MQDFPDLSRKAPRIVVYSGSSKLETKLDQPSIKGYAVGFQDLVQFVMSQLPQNEVVENALRKQVKLVPEITPPVIDPKNLPLLGPKNTQVRRQI